MAHEYGEQFLVKLGRQGKVVVGVIAVSEAFEGNGSVVVAKLRWVSMSDVLPTHLEHSRLWHVVNRVWSRVGKVRILGTDPPRHTSRLGTCSCQSTSVVALTEAETATMRTSLLVAFFIRATTTSRVGPRSSWRRCTSSIIMSRRRLTGLFLKLRRVIESHFSG